MASFQLLKSGTASSFLNQGLSKLRPSASSAAVDPRMWNIQEAAPQKNAIEEKCWRC